MKYPLAYNTWSKTEIAEVTKVLKSGNFTMDKKVYEFEKKFAKHFGSKFALMTNSGSSANLLMMSVLKYFPKFLKKKKKSKYHSPSDRLEHFLFSYQSVWFQN